MDFYEEQFIIKFTNILRYPYIILPKEVEDVYINKRFPDFKIPEKPIKPQMVNLPENNLNIVLLVTVFVSVLIGLQNPNYIIPFLVVDIIIFFVVITSKNNHEERYIKAKQDYNIQLEKYELRLSEYNKRLKYIIEKQSEQRVILANVEEKFGYIKDILSKFEPPKDVQSYDNYSIGITEKHFLQYAYKHFGDIVYTRKKLNCKYLLDKPYESAYYTEFFNEVQYYPDIAIVDKKLGIAIDIEVDEPYDMVNKEPIHYISKLNNGEKRFKNRDSLDSNKNHRSSDDLRDECITDCNWIVIRFSEEQVVQYPENCCYYIAGVINEITNTKKYNLNEFKQYENAREEMPDTHFAYNYNRWDYEYSKKFMVPACRRERMLIQEEIVPKITFVQQGWLNARQIQSLEENFNL